MTIYKYDWKLKGLVEYGGGFFLLNSTVFLRFIAVATV